VVLSPAALFGFGDLGLNIYSVAFRLLQLSKSYLFTIFKFQKFLSKIKNQLKTHFLDIQFKKPPTKNLSMHQKING
jgi:hypothetical protein